MYQSLALRCAFNADESHRGGHDACQAASMLSFQVLIRSSFGAKAATSMVAHIVMMLPMMLDGRVAVLMVLSKITAIGVRIARPEVLAIGVRVELRAIAGV
jgi:hypothetical protein